MSQVRTISQTQAPTFALCPLQEAIESFKLDREARRSTATTMAWYDQYLTALADWLTAHNITDPARVTANHIRAYLVSLEGRNLAPRTIHHHASAARALFNFCADEGLIPVSPMRKVKMPSVPKDLLPAFAPDDVRKLLDVCKTDRDRAIVLCLLDTGCRAAEFVALTVGCVDMTTGAVTVRQGKGKKDRVVFLGAKARKALRKYLASRPNRQATAPLWVCERGEDGLTQRGLQRMLYRVGEAAHVEHCHPHTFRRSFALWSLRAGMDVFSLQRLMGHSSLAVLRKYLDQAQEDLETAHKQHGAVDTLL